MSRFGENGKLNTKKILLFSILIVALIIAIVIVNIPKDKVVSTVPGEQSIFDADKEIKKDTYITISVNEVLHTGSTEFFSKVTFKVTRATGATIKNVEITKGSDAFYVSTENKNHTKDVTENGSYKIVVVYTYKDGETTKEASLTGNYSVSKIDVTGPSNAKPSFLAKTDTGATFKCNQKDAMGGIDESKTQYRLTNAAGTSGTYQSSNELKMTSGQKYYVQTKATDIFGYTTESEVFEYNYVNVPKPVIGEGGNISYTLTPNADKWTNGTVKVTVSTTAAGMKTLLSLTTTATDFKESTSITVDQNMKVYVKLSDGTNVSSNYATIDVKNIDKVNPTDAAPSASEITTSSFKVTCKQTDAASKINESTIRYRVLKDETTVFKAYQTSDTFTDIPAGEYFIQTKVTDNAGNTQESKLTTVKTKELDKTSTYISLKADRSISSWTNQDITVTANILKSLEGTPYKVVMSSDGGASYQERTQVVASEICTVKACLYDGTNYSEPITMNLYYIDKVAPTNTAPAITKVTSSSIIATSKQTDALSGVNMGETRYRLVDPDGNYGEWQNYGTFSKLNQDTTYKVQTRTIDNAGNEMVSELTSATTGKLPNTEDVLTLTPSTSNNEMAFSNVTVIAESSDPDLTIQMSKNGEKYLNVSTVVMESNGRVYGRLTDGVNYTEPIYIDVTNIQAPLPTPDPEMFTLEEVPTCTINPETWTRDTVRIRVDRVKDYMVQTKLNDGDWEYTAFQTVESNDDIVYARYYDGTSYSEEVRFQVTNIDKTPPNAEIPGFSIVERGLGDDLSIVMFTFQQTDDQSGIPQDTDHIKYRIIDPDGNIGEWQTDNIFRNIESYKVYKGQTLAIDLVGNEQISEEGSFMVVLYDDDGNMVDKEGHYLRRDENGNFVRIDNNEPVGGNGNTGNDNTGNNGSEIGTSISEDIDPNENNNPVNPNPNSGSELTEDPVNQDPVNQNPEPNNNNNNEQQEPTPEPVIEPEQTVNLDEVGEVKKTNETTQTEEQNEQTQVVEENNNNNVVVLVPKTNSPVGAVKKTNTTSNSTTNTSNINTANIVNNSVADSNMPKTGKDSNIGIFGIALLLIGISLYFVKRNKDLEDV